MGYWLFEKKLTPLRSSLQPAAAPAAPAAQSYYGGYSQPAPAQSYYGGYSQPAPVPRAPEPPKVEYVDVPVGPLAPRQVSLFVGG